MFLLKSRIVLIIGILISFSSCLRKTPDTPPDTSKENPNLKITHSIQQLKSLPLGEAIQEDVVVSGVVIMSDKNGNLFKSLIIQDSSAGIEVLADRSYLYPDFPEGRRVFIKCRNLYLSEKNGMISLGAEPDANGYVRPIPDPKIAEHLLPGEYPLIVVPDTIALFRLSIPSLAKRYQNTLVYIQDIQFAEEETIRQMSYAQPPNVNSLTTLSLENCDAVSVALTTSGYANFQAIKIPNGKGAIRAVYRNNNEQPFLMIRDTSDVRMNGQRCENFEHNDSVISISKVKKMPQNTPLDKYTIRGIIISDKAQQNVEKNVFIFQGNHRDAGIALLIENASYALGDSLEIDISGSILSDYFGVLALKNLATTQIKLLDTKRKIRAEAANIAQIKRNPQYFESKLVKIFDITWSVFPNTFNGVSGNLLFADATDSMYHFCYQSAVFKDQSIPSKFSKSITGIIQLRNNFIFFNIRNTDDLE